MKIKEKIVSFFMSKVDIDFFSNLIKKHKRIFGIPYKIIAQTLIDYEFPRLIFVESTSICNLKCKMCPRNSNPIKLGSMETGLFNKIVDEAKNYGKRSFCLHLFGEPLADNTIIDKIKYIKKSNPENSVLLTTNGVLLTSEISKALIENKVDKIAISIHSPDAKTYQNITGFDKLEAVEKNIKELIRLKKESFFSNPKIILRVIRMPENEHEIKDFIKKWEKYPVKIEIRDEHNYGGKIESNPLKNPPRKRYPCYHLWFSPGINWVGETTICCDDVSRQATIGDTNNSTVHEIWNGDALKKYRKYHLSGQYDKISACKNCDVWDIYPDIFFDWQKK
mgnify:CR=1 FL=1